MRAIFHDYLIEKDTLWKRFNESDKNKQGWYYKGLVEGLNSLSGYKEYQEFRELVIKVFG